MCCLKTECNRSMLTTIFTPRRPQPLNRQYVLRLLQPLRKTAMDRQMVTNLTSSNSWETRNNSNSSLKLYANGDR